MQKFQFQIITTFFVGKVGTSTFNHHWTIFFSKCGANFKEKYRWKHEIHSFKDDLLQRKNRPPGGRSYRTFLTALNFRELKHINICYFWTDLHQIRCVCRLGGCGTLKRFLMKWQNFEGYLSIFLDLDREGWHGFRPFSHIYNTRHCQVWLWNLTRIVQETKL